MTERTIFPSDEHTSQCQDNARRFMAEHWKGPNTQFSSDGASMGTGHATCWPCICGATDLSQALTKLDLQDGDIVFVDAEAIDCSKLLPAITGMIAGPEATFIPIRNVGKPLRDCFMTMSRTQAKVILEAIGE